MISEETKSALKRVGLTEYQARTYSGLVNIGPTTASKLSEKTDVPQSRIYDVLSKLEKRGWIESQSTRPARYRAKPPSEALRLVQIKKQEEIKKATKKAKQELQSLYEEDSEVQKPDVWLVRGKKELLSKIREMLSNAEIEVLITLPTNLQDFHEFQEYIPMLQREKINIRVLTPEEGKTSKELQKQKNIEIRKRKPLFGGGVIIDGKKILLIIRSNEKSLGIWSEEIGLAKFGKQYFEYLWTDTQK